MIQYSIKRKLVSAIVITSSLLTTLVVILNYYIEYSNDLDDIEVRSRQIEKSILPSLTNSVWNLDINGISTQLKGISALEDVLYVEIKENKNQIFSEGNPKLVLNSSTILKTFPLVQEIENERFNIGQIKIFFSLDNIQEKLIKKIVFFTTFQFLKTLILTIIFFVIFQQILVRHVDKISLFLKRFNIESTSFSPLALSRPSSKRGKQDELDELCNSINTITERIVRNNTYKNQIIKKQENEIVFKNTLEKNELFLKKFSNINSVFDNELRNTFILINKSFDALSDQMGDNNSHLEYLKKECHKIQFLIQTGQLVAQYRNELKARFSMDQIISMIMDEGYKCVLDSSAKNFSSDLIFNMKRLQQCLNLIKNELNSTIEVAIINDKLILRLDPKRIPDPNQFELSLITAEESFMGILSLIILEENWKLTIEGNKLNFIV